MALKTIKNLLNEYFATEYGSFRGFLRVKKYILYYYLGRYNKYRAIDWKHVKRLVFVCKGNICRSAFAEAVAKSLSLEAASLGVDASDNSPADFMAVCNAKKMGFSLDAHLTTSISSFQKREGDLYVAMEPSHIEAMNNNDITISPVTLAGLWCEKILPHIEDPYGKPDEYFYNCFTCIEKLVCSLKDQMQRAE